MTNMKMDFANLSLRLELHHYLRNEKRAKARLTKQLMCTSRMRSDPLNLRDRKGTGNISAKSVDRMSLKY